MDPTIGQGYSDYIGTRTKPGQNQVEYYNKQNNMAFENPQQLFGFASTLSQGPVGSFDQIAAGFTPRAQAIDQITQGLNQQQNQTFQEQQQPAQRQSSLLQQNIDTENKGLTDALAEFNTLKTKLTSIQAPNYQQEYNDLRTQAGVPGIENDFANNQKTIRELPYVNRQNMGNAGVATEAQLGADTQQKGIPLEIQQANLLDRLKLAGDFVNNSLKFKEMDSNAARESLGTAINLVMQSVDLSRNHVNDLLTQQKSQQERDQIAQQFAFENRITAPFYDIAGTVYRTSDRMPAHNPQEYIAMGGKGDFTDVQKISPQVKPLEVSAGASLYDPATGKLITTAPKTTNSGGSGGSSGSSSSNGKYTPAKATSEITAEWSKGYIQGNGKISSLDYKKGKEWWLANGLSASSFDKQFGYLIDKSSDNWKGDYGYGGE